MAALAAPGASRPRKRRMNPAMILGLERTVLARSPQVTGEEIAAARFWIERLT